MGRFTLLFGAVLLLAACGGGGSSGPVPGTGAHNSNSGTVMPTPSVAPSSGPGVAHFAISDPYSTAQSLQRRPQYFSPATAAIRIITNGTSAVLNLSANSSNCKVANGNISCAIDVAVNNGTLNYSVQTLDHNAVVLSQASGTATINGTTTIALALQGVWKTATVQFANEHPLMGTPSTIAVKISAYDADSALIIGPEPYATPIQLQNSDTSGATTLSKTSVTYPCACVTLTYNGTSYVNATVTPVDPSTGVSGQGDMLVPALHVTEYSVPSGSVSATNGGHGRMIANSDSSLTFLEQNMHIGRVTMAGAVTETTVQHYYLDIAETADGTLWGVTNNSTIDRINGDGSATQVALLPAYPANSSTGTLTAGSDGNVWATIRSNVGPAVTRVTPAGQMNTFVATDSQYLGDSVLGSDGNIWFAASKNSVGEFVRLTPNGQFTTFSVTGLDCCDTLGNVALSPDGQVYSLLGQKLVARVSTVGAVSDLPDGFLPSMSFYGQSINNALGFGPDGALWVSGAIAANAYCDPVVERMTTSGQYAILELPITCNSSSGPLPAVTSFIAGRDGNLWYTRDKFVGKIVLK